MKRELLQKLLKTLLFLFTGIVPAISQNSVLNLAGIVKDGQANSVLQGASVELRPADSADNKKMIHITDSLGRFNFTALKKRTYDIAVSMVGFEKFFISALYLDPENSFSPLTILLKPDNQILKEVIVSSQKPFLVFSGNKIELNVAQNLVALGSNANDILKKAPGIQLSNENILFRGKKVSILINGRPSYLKGANLSDMLATLPANTIEKIEIIPSPSAKYDAEGGSIVNIILSKDKTHGTNFVANTGFTMGRNPGGNMGIIINNRGNRTNFYSSYSFNNTVKEQNSLSLQNTVSSDLTENGFLTKKSNSHLFKLGLDYTISPKSSTGFLVNTTLNYQHHDQNSYSLYKTNTSDENSSSTFLKRKVRFLYPTVNIYYKAIVNKKGGEINLNADYVKYDQRYHDDITSRFFAPDLTEYKPADKINTNIPRDIDLFTFSADYDQNVKNGKVGAGIKTIFSYTDNLLDWKTFDGSQWVADNTISNHFLYKENINAAYINYTHRFKNWELEAGLRAEQTNTRGESVTINSKTEKQYLDLFPSVNLQYTKHPKHIYSFNYRRGISRFGFNYVNPFVTYQTAYSYYKGNPDLVPELDNSVSLDYTYNQNLSIGYEFMYSTKILGPVFVTEDSILIQSYDNIDRGIASTIYFSWFKKIGVWSPSVSIYGGYFQFKMQDGDTWENTTSTSVILQTSNQFQLKKSIAIEAAINYSSPIAYGVKKTKSNFSTDLAVSKRFQNGKYSLSASVSDVFNTSRNRYEVNDDELNLYTDTKTESRFYNLTFQWKFGNKYVKPRVEKPLQYNDIQKRIN